MDFKDYAAVMQMGGLLAFSWVVWNELRTQRTERSTTDVENRKVQSEILKTLTTLSSLLTTSQRRRTKDDTLRERPNDDDHESY
jgi:hypothetical protein